MKKSNKHIGSKFDDFLKENNLLEQAEAVAIKRVIAFQLSKTMKIKGLTKTLMVKRMHTSRSSIERLFDPENESVTLLTLNKAATTLGRKLKVELV
jgi:predicted XRE-type DNA-binding protein